MFALASDPQRAEPQRFPRLPPRMDVLARRPSTPAYSQPSPLAPAHELDLLKGFAPMPRDDADSWA